MVDSAGLLSLFRPLLPTHENTRKPRKIRGFRTSWSSAETSQNVPKCPPPVVITTARKPILDSSFGQCRTACR